MLQKKNQKKNIKMPSVRIDLKNDWEKRKYNNVLMSSVRICPESGVLGVFGMEPPSLKKILPSTVTPPPIETWLVHNWIPNVSIRGGMGVMILFGALALKTGAQRKLNQSWHFFEFWGPENWKKHADKSGNKSINKTEPGSKYTQNE